MYDIIHYVSMIKYIRNVLEIFNIKDQNTKYLLYTNEIK